MNGNLPLDQQRAKMAEDALDATLKAATDKANEYRGLARRQRTKYSVAKTFAVVLGVLTPTFVAFQTQHSIADHPLLLGITATCLTAGAGIVSGLQAAFKWGEGFGRSATAAQQLDQMVGSITMKALLPRTTSDYGMKYDQMKDLQQEVSQQMQRIIQTHSQSEIADVTELIKSPAGSSVPAGTPTTTKAP